MNLIRARRVRDGEQDRLGHWSNREDAGLARRESGFESPAVHSKRVTPAPGRLPHDSGRDGGRSRGQGGRPGRGGRGRQARGAGPPAPGGPLVRADTPPGHRGFCRVPPSMRPRRGRRGDSGFTRTSRISSRSQTDFGNEGANDGAATAGSESPTSGTGCSTGSARTCPASVACPSTSCGKAGPSSCGRPRTARRRRSTSATASRSWATPWPSGPVTGTSSGSLTPWLSSGSDWHPCSPGCPTPSRQGRRESTGYPCRRSGEFRS
jgi:hypothetical protein